MKNALNWFEIPVTDMTRACRFYSSLLATELETTPSCGGQMAVLPHENGAVGGCLFQHEQMSPANHGTMIYLDAGGDLAAMLGRVESAGGRIDMPITRVSDEVGDIALIIDTEGNRVGLHAPR